MEQIKVAWKVLKKAIKRAQQLVESLVLTMEDEVVEMMESS